MTNSFHHPSPRLNNMESIFRFYTKKDNPLCPKKFFGYKRMTQGEAEKYAERYDLVFEQMGEAAAKIIMDKVSIFELKIR